ncbi:MAG: hypothetical protein V7727_18015 [Sneathiella sp.]
MRQAIRDHLIGFVGGELRVYFVICTILAFQGNDIELITSATVLATVLTVAGWFILTGAANAKSKQKKYTRISSTV